MRAFNDVKAHYHQFRTGHTGTEPFKKPFRPHRAIVLIAALAALLLSAMAGFAQNTAYSFSSAPVTREGFLSLGILFTTNQEITVTSLGYYDHDQVGFATNHVVGIFDQAGNLLVSTELVAGDEDELDGMFRYKEIAATTLPAGRVYTLAATTGGSDDFWAYGNRGSSLVDFEVHPGITISDNASRYLYQGDNTLRFPEGQWGYTVYSGPNFK